MQENMIYNADCFELLKEIPNNYIDLILTDPPYIISKESHFDTGGAWNDAPDKKDRKTPPKTDFGEWDKQSMDLDALFKEWYRILKPHGTVVCFYDIWKMQELKYAADNNKFKQPRLGCWTKTNPVPVNSKLNYLSNAKEYFATFVKISNPTFHSEYDDGTYNYPICHGKERTSHPTQKPLSLMTDLVNKHSNEGDLVLDCFIGSGTTAIACINTGRRYIGIEADAEYFEIAKQRIKSNFTISEENTI